jgi:hypothetical protein
MSYQTSIGSLALVAALCGTFAGALAFDETKYPDWKGQWHRFEIGPDAFDPSKPPRDQQAPLTPEYQAIFEANLRDRDAGGWGIDPTYTCLSPGMPRIMNMYEPMEIVVTPRATHIMTQHIHDARRIYTDGRGLPRDVEPSFGGYSIGRWIDENGDGRYDVLEVETRALKGPRTYDSTGIPFHEDNETIITERIYGDKTDADILYDQITSTDHALTRPWTVLKKYRRDPNPRPVWRESVCAEKNNRIEIAKEVYLISADGYLMPSRSNQPPPNLRYFKAIQQK